MESTAKIHLSAEEAGLIGNTAWILTKHQIIKKVYQLFGQVNEAMRQELTGFHHLFEEVQHRAGKISRGENYRLLPYIILDYPSCFTRDNIFAVRTMFWWGKFFSVTLHLSGAYKTRYINNNPDFISFLQQNNFFICINKEQWEHHFEGDNYVQATDLSNAVLRQILEQPFLKVAKKISLENWDETLAFIMSSFKQILELLQINFQDDKKDLLPVFPTTGSDL